MQCIFELGAANARTGSGCPVGNDDKYCCCIQWHIAVNSMFNYMSGVHIR